MRSSEPPIGSSGHEDNRRGARQPQDAPALPGILAAAARALAETPVHADDAMLVAALGRAIVPALGEVIALYAADESGRLRLLGAAPDDASLPGIREQEGQQSGLAAEVTARPGAASPDSLLVIGSSDSERHYDEAARSAVDVLADLVALRRAARQQAAREAALSQQVASMVQAGRELAHLLNNDLTMPVGVVELLLDRNNSSPDLQEMLQAAAHDLAALEQHVRAFHEQLRSFSPDQRP